MIILDTNVLSTLMKAVPDPQVVRWLDGLPAESIWTTSVCVFEIRYGLRSMPKGKRQRALTTAFEEMVTEALESRVLDFDQVAADHSAGLAARLRAAGRPVEFRDVLIAGIVAARRATLATGNVRHFELAAINLVNPWDAR